MDSSLPGFHVLHYLTEFAQTHIHWVGDIMSFPSPPACNLSQHQSFPVSRLFATTGGQIIRASASPSNEYSGLISFWMDWFDLFAVKGLSGVFFTTRVRKYQFFSTRPSLRSNSHLYMTTGKTIDLTIWTCVSKVMSLLFNMLSRFVIVFFPRCSCL